MSTKFSQNFAAGAVIAAVAIEFIQPIDEATGMSSMLYTLFGIIVGVSVMLILRYVTVALSGNKNLDNEAIGMHPGWVSNESDEDYGTMRSDVEDLQDDSSKSVVWHITWAVAVDMLVDGILVGVSSVLGYKSGWLISIAISLELFSLALSFTTFARSNDNKSPYLTIIGCAIGLPCLMISGALAGAFFSSSLSPHASLGMLGFALGSVLFLIMDDLLVDAADREGFRDGIYYTCARVFFFVGFMVPIVLSKYITPQGYFVYGGHGIMGHDNSTAVDG
jgi:zinc transporter ZupT